MSESIGVSQPWDVSVPFPGIVETTGIPFYRNIERIEGATVVVDGRSLLMLGSSDYLGFAQHPQVREASVQALQRYGASCSGSPALNGYLQLHQRLERDLADFLEREAVALFASGYQANLGILSALGSSSGALICDRLIHASLIDGTRLARTRVTFFRHNDVDSLDRALGKTTGADNRLVLTEGAFSVDGDLGDLPTLSRQAQAHGARLLVDEAHSLGTVGATGRGAVERFGPRAEVDLISGTFSKALASTGGFVAGPAEVIDLLRNRSRPLVFSASLAPPCAAAAQASLQLLRKEPERVDALRRHTAIFSRELRDAGYAVAGGESPILTLLCGETTDTVAFWRRLFELGLFTNAVIPPGVPPRTGRIRLSVTSLLSEARLTQAVEIFRQAAPSYPAPN